MHPSHKMYDDDVALIYKFLNGLKDLISMGVVTEKKTEEEENNVEPNEKRRSKQPNQKMKRNLKIV